MEPCEKCGGKYAHRIDCVEYRGGGRILPRSASEVAEEMMRHRQEDAEKEAARRCEAGLPMPVPILPDSCARAHIPAEPMKTFLIDPPGGSEWLREEREFTDQAEAERYADEKGYPLRTRIVEVRARVHTPAEEWQGDDPVSHPKHYIREGIEAIDVIEAFALENYRRASALKYLLRAGQKGDLVEDLRKAIWFIEREIKATLPKAPSLPT